MSCAQWVEVVVRDCASWAIAHRNSCMQQSSERVRQCTDWVRSSRQDCQEWHNKTTRTCTEWGNRWHQECCNWPPCSWLCDALVWVAEKVCLAWSTVTTSVCDGYLTVVDWACRAWDWIVRTTCVVWATIVVGACAGWGRIAKKTCGLLGAFNADIVFSEGDEPAAGSMSRLEATSMSIARVASETAYADSGTRFFFRIREGQVEVSTLTSDWQLVQHGPGEGAKAISYKRLRIGRMLEPTPCFDMVAADCGRVFAKERGRARFFFTMLDPMFRREGNRPVPSAYFKLDPEQGLETANNADRVRQLSEQDDSNHPAAVRFPLFRKAMEIDQNDSMVVVIDSNMGIWHHIDARPPKDAGEPPDPREAPGVPPIHEIVTYAQNGLPPPVPRHIVRHGYLPIRVLDIGVGHEHWHEQRCRIYGGEMDSLDGPGLHFILNGRDVYRMFNGPVEDQGGFIDGTVNYYVLAQLLSDEEIDAKPMPPANAFGILWLDEQAVLSERWRLVSPDDSRFGGFRDIIPSAMVQYMDKDFRHFRFDRSKFWDPMRAGHVSRKSRMAVSRQVIVLSGRDPTSGEAQLFTINFSFGTSDRTWRWRSFPPKTDLSCAFDLREDMTIFVREADGPGRYWFQRYLPASGSMKPDGQSLLLAPDVEKKPDRSLEILKPEKGFQHPWQWLPNDVFAFVHAHFSHFGCYEERVDWRWQYYRVELYDEEFARSESDGAPWIERGDQLHITKASLNWPLINAIVKGDLAALSAVGADISARVVAAVTHVASGELTQQELIELLTDLQQTELVKQVHIHGLFHEQFVLKLLYREPIGWILVHWDKRDDDLLPFRDMATNEGTPFELTLVPDRSNPPDQSVRLLVKTYHRVLDPPAVEAARVILFCEDEEVQYLRIELQPANIAPLDENIWRIKLGALLRDPQSDSLVGAERLFDEIRVESPVQDMPRQGWFGYQWDIRDWGRDRITRLNACCSDPGRIRYGTSLWFENIVGHVARPDAVEYLTSMVS